MLKPLLRWIIPLTALLLVGPAAGMCTSQLRSVDGSGAATLLVCDSPVRGILMGLVALGLAAVVGVIASRVLTIGMGLFSAGLVLAWAAWGTGTVDDLIRQSQSTSTLWRLAAEGAIFGPLGLAVAWLIVRAGRHHTPQQGAPGVGGANSWTVLAYSVGACLVAATVVAWIAAAEPLKGQSFAAAALAGLFGALACKLGGRTRLSLLISVAVVALLAVAGPAVAAIYHGGSDMAVVKASYANKLFPLARILPLDWLAGAFVGIPIGLSWGTAMTEPQHHAS